MPRIKVMIVDDSAVMVRLLSDIVGKDPRIEIVGTAANGEECVQKARDLKPQVILLDLEMPVMNGVDAIKELSRLGLDVAVLAVSAYAKPGFALLERALEAGAFDFVLKPANPLEIEKIARQITTNIFVASISRSKQIPKLTAADLQAKTAAAPAEKARSVTVIGCSTGGKQSLQQLLPQLPADFTGIVIAVVHLPAFVVKTYLRELGRDCKVPVREIEDGREVLPGHIYVVGIGNSDFVVRRKKEEPNPRFEATVTEPISGSGQSATAPSIDAMMESAAKLFGADCQGVLLSGTGRDGVKGLRHIQVAKGFTMAEDKGSASVPQLPQAAVEFGSVDKVLHVKEILARVRG